MDMAPFNDLSNELHHFIAGNLSEDILFNLISLKSFYFHAWMDLKWNAVVLDLEGAECHRLIWRMS
jgi:hypothetical protein